MHKRALYLEITLVLQAKWVLAPPFFQGKGGDDAHKVLVQVLPEPPGVAQGKSLVLKELLHHVQLGFDPPPLQLGTQFQLTQCLLIQLDKTSGHLDRQSPGNLRVPGLVHDKLQLFKTSGNLQDQPSVV